MPNVERYLLLLANSTLTATGNGSQVVLGAAFTAVRFHFKVDAGTGTSPTLNMRIQAGIKAITTATDTNPGRDLVGATYDWTDFCAFPQVTTGAKEYYADFVGGSSEIYEQTATMTANTIRSGPLSNVIRVRYTIGGTNPSFANCYVTAQLIP